MSKNILVTGGHHSSSIPLILKLQKDGYKITFVGHKYASVLNKFESSEYKEITALGIDYINLSSPKFYNVKGVLKYLKLLNSILKSIKIVFSIKPTLVISYGGYLAVPIVIASKIFNVKVVTHEQTLTVGLANRIIQKFSNIVFVSWEENTSDNKKYVYAGLPLRDEILNVTKKSPRNLKTLFVQGGKQGSHTLNSFIFKNIHQLTSDFIIFHQTSKHSINTDHLISKDLENKFKDKYFAFEFIFGKDYTDILNKSDFVLSRSGAHIVYEMSYLKMPSIFVPIPWASQNEQVINAKNATLYTPRVVLEESSLDIESFYKCVNNLKQVICEKKEYKDVKTDSLDVMYSFIKKLIS